MYLSSYSLPPRSVPLLSRLVILNGGMFSLFGWIFFGFGMIFFWIFFMNSEAKHWFSFTDWEEGKAKILRVEETNASENEVSVLKYIYEFDHQGETYTGRSYSTGYRYSEGQEVDIEFDPSDPGDSRIEGERREMFGGMVIFVVIFPLVGLIFILSSLHTNIKALDLVINGKFTQGKLKSKEPTNTTINESRVYKYIFEFQADNGRTYEATGKTHITSLLEDEETEKLIYLPAKPDYAVMFDTLPGKPDILPDGNLAPIPLSRAWALIVPLVVILGHGSYFYFAYLA